MFEFLHRLKEFIFGKDEEPAAPAPASDPQAAPAAPASPAASFEPPAVSGEAAAARAQVGEPFTDPAAPGAEGGRDVTESYHDLVTRAQAGENTLPEDAQKYAYLMVPGLFTEHYPGYMDPNIARMRALGLDPQTVGIDTDASVEENAKAIRDAIMKEVAESGREVVLTGQSKGGVDISAAIAMFPELKEHVRAVVSMQAPYAGTPIADDIESSPIMSRIAGGAIEGVFGGDRRALSDLTTESRASFNAEHPYPTDVPTVSLATSESDALSPMGLNEAYMQHVHGKKSDGLVAQEDAVLPGSDVVRLDNTSHAETVFDNPLMRGSSGDRPGDITQALLTLALQKATAQERERAAPP